VSGGERRDNLARVGSCESLLSEKGGRLETKRERAREREKIIFGGCVESNDNISRAGGR
jgi:hypothetical protein